jgi:hypothetical protein
VESRVITTQVNHEMRRRYVFAGTFIFLVKQKIGLHQFPTYR